MPNICKDALDAPHYDAKSIDRGETLTTVMVKEIFTETVKAHVMRSLAAVRGIDEISYLLTKTEIDCPADAFTYFTAVCYTAENKVIYEQLALE